MGKITRSQAISILRADNKTASEDDLNIYADSFLAYAEASINIEANGVIVAHPRTGAPMENPYLRIRTAAQASMSKIRRISKTKKLWDAVKNEKT